MRRHFLTVAVFVAGLCVATPGRGPSIADVFVAATEAVEETDGAVCMMPDGVDGTGQQIAIPKSSNAEGGDLPPVRMVVDPYPSFNGVAVDTSGDLVMMSDTNRKSLLVYDRTAGSLPSKAAATPRRQILG